MTLHFREHRPGRFYLRDERSEPKTTRSEVPPFLRFAAAGVALPLWKGHGATSDELLPIAHLDWNVQRREVVIPEGAGLAQPTTARHYRALVRPDTQQIMSVVSSHYSVAENRWVAQATEHLARRRSGGPAPMIAAVGFGRDGERTLFAARVSGDTGSAVCLLAYNTHGGEGSVRFQLIECDRRTQTTYVLDTANASASFPHVGDLRERLERASQSRTRETFVDSYLAETEPLWTRLRDALWTRRHTAALIQTLWGDTPGPEIELSGVPGVTGGMKDRHPGHHLPRLMHGITDAANAYRTVCDWIDNYSEACERGDFTKDRDERLALGAGSKFKREAWRWILNNP